VLKVDVLHVCYGGVGGVRSIVNLLAAEFSKVGLTTGVIAIAAGEELALDADAWPGVSLVQPVVLKGRADLSSTLHAFAFARRVQAAAAFIHSPRHALPVYLGRRLSGQRGNLVTVEHTPVQARSRALNLNSASSIACSRAIVFVTAENAAGYPLRRLPFRALARTTVAPNGVYLADFSASDDPAREAEEGFRIGMAARFVAQKDFDTLIEAMTFLQHACSGRSVRLALAGDGPDLSRVKQLAASLGVDHSIDFVGALPESQIPKFLCGLDVYVHSTHSETSSISLLEAAAARVPIVASDVEGVHDIFTQGVHARLTQPRSPQSLASGILEVLRDRELASRLATHAYDLVASEHTSSEMAAAYLGVLNRIDVHGPWGSAADALKSRERRRQ